MEKAKFLMLLPKTKVDERKEEKDKIDKELLPSPSRDSVVLTFDRL